MEVELYKAIIHTALRDLFTEGKHREEAWEWFNETVEHDIHSLNEGVSFVDCADLAEYDYKQWRYVAELIYTGRLGKDQYAELMSPVEEKRPERHSKMLNIIDMPRTTYIYNVRSFKTLEEANLYSATLS